MQIIMRDLQILAIFIILSAVSHSLSYYFIMDHQAEAKAVRMQISILIYGSTQAFIGFLGGYFISKAVIQQDHIPLLSPYSFVKSDDDILD